MRAAYVERLGPAAGIRYGELPDPVPGPGEALVRVIAAAVDNVDTFVRSGAYRTPVSFPLALGRDIVGEVVEPGPSGFRAGDRVWSNSLGYGGRPGASAELARVPADRLYPLPGGVDPVEAVAVLHPAATAYTGLVHHARLRPGETLYVAGGNGAVGSSMIRMAGDLGARVIASARGPAGGRRAALAGAAEVIDSAAADPHAALRELLPGGVDVHCDTTGRGDAAAAVPLLAARGRLLVMAGLGAGRGGTPLDARELYVHGRSIVGFAISLATAAELAEAAGWVNRRLPDLRLETTVLPLSRAREAHEVTEAAIRGEGRRLPGRLVLRVSPE